MDCGFVIFDFRLVVEGKRFTRHCAGYDYQALHDDLHFAHSAWPHACLENPQSTIFSPQFWVKPALSGRFGKFRQQELDSRDHVSDNDSIVKQKSDMKMRILYAGLVLVIVILMMIIGYLGHALLTLDTPPLSFPPPRVAVTPEPDIHPGARRDILIEAGAIAPAPYPDIQEADYQSRAFDPFAGIVPTICRDAGAEIAYRDSYRGPVTYRAITGPNEVVLFLNLPSPGD